MKPVRRIVSGLLLAVLASTALLGLGEASLRIAGRLRRGVWPHTRAVEFNAQILAPHVERRCIEREASPKADDEPGDGPTFRTATLNSRAKTSQNGAVRRHSAWPASCTLLGCASADAALRALEQGGFG